MAHKTLHTYSAYSYTHISARKLLLYNKLQAMPKRCIAAGCISSSREGYSLHAFPRDESIRKKWIMAVKRQQSNWNGPTAYSVLCSKHFEMDCFVAEGSRNGDSSEEAA